LKVRFSLSSVICPPVTLGPTKFMNFMNLLYNTWYAPIIMEHAAIAGNNRAQNWYFHSIDWERDESATSIRNIVTFPSVGAHQWDNELLKLRRDTEFPPALASKAWRTSGRVSPVPKSPEPTPSSAALPAAFWLEVLPVACWNVSPNWTTVAWQQAQLGQTHGPGDRRPGVHIRRFAWRLGGLI
jgi:hypothetical protein